jgi:hypothetical protein
MTRSRRKTPITGITTCRSEKSDKQIANRRMRHKARLAIHHGLDHMPLLREVSNIWNFGKDGKTWRGNSRYWGESWFMKMFRK